MASQVLVVDDEEIICSAFKEFLSRDGYLVRTAFSFDAALRAIDEERFDLIFTDINMGDKSGIDLLKEVRGRGLDAYVLMITGFPNLETAQEALRHGAFDYVAKPVLMETLRRLARRALEHKQLRDEKERLRRNMEAVFRSVQDGIVTVDQDLFVTSANDATFRICKRLNKESLSRDKVSLEDLCSGICRKAMERVFKERQTVEMARVKCQGDDDDAAVITLRASPLIDEQHRFAGGVLVIQDETRLNDLERDLKQRGQFHRLVGSSPSMARIYRLIEDLAQVETTVLITGESGTGKELVAEALHYQGVRANQSLVEVNCAGLPETLLESELFGHVRGAFTGAIRDKVGRFQLADKGTIFLDEIGDISPRMQTRLLRVLQEKSFERVGEGNTTEVNVRVVAATNQNLRAKVADKSFREDLYYRLKVVEIYIPPLRERRGDIPLLTDHFIRLFNQKFHKGVTGATDRVMRLFMQYDWPGNVRELEHALEHAFVICRQKVLDVDDLPPEFNSHPSAPPAPAPTAVMQEGVDIEKSAIINALERAGWVKAKAARILGISRSTIYRRISELNIEDPPEAFL